MSAPNPWLAVQRPAADAKLRLFCFPSAGGAASMYQTWVGDLPAGIDVIRLQPPGREGRFTEPACGSFAELLPQVREAIEPWLDVPFAFFGHSMGALVSYEVTRMLRADGGPQPAAFYPSGHRAPHLPMRRDPWADLPRDELIAELKDIDGIPDLLLENEELLDVVLPTVRTDLRAYEAYAFESGEPLGCPITVFSGTEDKLVDEPEREGWREHTAGECVVHALPGRHFFINDQRELVLGHLARDLARVMERG